MPHPAWKHYCTEYGCEVISGRSTCESCGMLGQYDGWHFGRIEKMVAYVRRTGLAPIGTHRPLTDMILSPLLSLCEGCEGRGVLCEDDEHWYRCPQCDGMRTIPNVSEAEFEATRRRILREFPEAAAPVTAADP